MSSLPCYCSTMPTDDASTPDLGERTLDDLYFEIQSELDFTKHIGALEATDEIVELCGIQAQSHVLDVGCGVGATAAYLAKNIACHITGIDLREAMIERANERAERDGVSDRVSFQVADAADLPFGDGAFDVVICESLLALVEDQPVVLAEMYRVLEPAGRLGITEAAWMKPPTDELLRELDRSFGHLEPHSPTGWRELIEKSGFENVVVHAHKIKLATEGLSRVRRYGLGHLFKSWGHLMVAMLRDRRYRQLMKKAKQQPKELLTMWGYIVAVAHKPSRS